MKMIASSIPTEEPPPYEDVSNRIDQNFEEQLPPPTDIQNIQQSPLESTTVFIPTFVEPTEPPPAYQRPPPEPPVSIKTLRRWHIRICIAGLMTPPIHWCISPVIFYLLSKHRQLWSGDEESQKSWKGASGFLFLSILFGIIGGCLLIAIFTISATILYPYIILSLSTCCTLMYLNVINSVIQKYYAVSSLEEKVLATLL